MAADVNILLILCDQYRGDCLSITGHPVVKTPNLDDIGRNAVVFTSAFTSCPSCIGARASLFTGLYPTNHDRIGYKDCIPWEYDNMLAQVLSDRGYQTHCVGKTHFYPMRKHCGFQGLDSYECSHTFDEDYVNDYNEWLREKSGGSLREFDHGLTETTWNARPSTLPEELHNNSWVVAKGIEFIRRRDKTRPFLLNLSFQRPHPPIDPPQVFWDMYKDLPLPPVPIGDWAEQYDRPITGLNTLIGHLDESSLARARRGYYAQIGHIDCQIGRMLRYLECEAKVGPTVIIFTADHGNMLGDHHLHRKANPYQGSVKIPLIIYHPDMDDNLYRNSPNKPAKGEGFLCYTPVILEDLYSTILECAGVTVPENVDGISLLPLLERNGTIARDYIHGEHSSAGAALPGMQFLTDGMEKYIWFTESGQEQLFDLVNDPQELKDLAANPEKKRRLEHWRCLLIKHLAPRVVDGLSDGKKLIPGKTLPAIRTGR